MLRNHVGMILSCAVAALLFAGLVFGCDAYMKTASTMTPGKSVNAEQLQGEVAQKQAAFSGQETDLQAQYTKLSQQVTAYNGNVAAAQADLQQKQATVQNVVSVLGGVVATAAKGSFDPLSLLTTLPTLAIGALGVGAMADKRSLTTALNNARQPAAASPSPAGGGGAVAVQVAAQLQPDPAPTLSFLKTAA